MTTPSARSDDELLQVTRTVLADQGFHVETMSGSIDLVLAENSYFVIAVAAMNTIGELIQAEPVAFEALTQLMSRSLLAQRSGTRTSFYSPRRNPRKTMTSPETCMPLTTTLQGCGASLTPA